MDNSQRSAEQDREHVYDVLDIALEWARRGRDRSVTVVAIELDELDLDDLGALRADVQLPAMEELLDIVSSRLANLQSVTSLRTGETLVLVSTAPRSHYDAISLADRAARAIARPVETGGSELSVTAGMGVRLSRNGMSDARRLLRDARSALDEAQRRGRSEIAMFSSEYLHRERSREDVRMHFEPVVSLRDGRVSHYEAAAVPRCRAGFGDADAQTLEVLLDQLALAMTTWPLDVDVSFNVSASQLFDARFPLPVLEAADRYSLAHDRFMIEIEERQVAEDLPLLRRVLTRLRDDGWRVGLDAGADEGATLVVLAQLPVQFVKIDCGRAEGEEFEMWDLGAVAAARSLQVATIGKGIAALPELALAIAHEYDFAQGELFGMQPSNPSEPAS